MTKAQMLEILESSESEHIVPAFYEEEGQSVIIIRNSSVE